MAKGKANPALHIVVWEWWMTRPEIVALKEAGHGITSTLRPGDEVDLILHPAAHKWNDSMWESPYLKAALSDARKLRRGGNKK